MTGEVGASRVYELAGDEPFTLADVAAVLSEAAGRTVGYQNMTEAAYRDALVGAGVPAGFAAALAEYSAKAASSILADRSRSLSSPDRPADRDDAGRDASCIASPSG